MFLRSGRSVGGRLPGALLALCVCLTVAGCDPPASYHMSLRPSSVRVDRALADSPHPNIVFVLTDDLSMDLVRYMPHVLSMKRDGLTFKDYFVSDSLCCPSRASIFTGNLPHDTHVFGNSAADHGGYKIFYDRGEEAHTFAITLQRAGYLTAMMGKYINGYMPQPGKPDRGSSANVPDTYVPPGWNEWDVAGWGYREFRYQLNSDGLLQHFGHRPSAYLTDVLARRGVRFIHIAAARHRPFFLELATFAPHSPYVPAPRDRHDFPGLKAPRPPSFNVLPTHPPQWLAYHRRLVGWQTARINRAFRRRVQSVQAVDRLIGKIEDALAATGTSRDTYLVFSSDNGLHMGEYRLMPGKLTAFDTDIHVPLIVTGPRVKPATKTHRMAENIDLAPTFAAIGGSALPSDGHSLLSLFNGNRPPDWRNAVLVEHQAPRPLPSDPDFQKSSSGHPTTYEAMRTKDYLYVEYSDGEREFYNLRRDPFELHNIVGQISPLGLVVLHQDLQRLEQCHDGKACWSAMHVAPLAQAGL